jgi:hypothetical protein
MRSLSGSKSNLSGYAVKILLSFRGDDSRELLKLALFILLDNRDGFKLLERPTDDLSSSTFMGFWSVSVLGTSSKHVGKVSYSPMTANVDLTS